MVAIVFWFYLYRARQPIESCRKIALIAFSVW